MLYVEVDGVVGSARVPDNCFTTRVGKVGSMDV